MDSNIKAVLIAALLGTIGAVLRYLLVFNWAQVAREAVDTARQLQFAGNTVKFRNLRRRRLGLRASIMVDVFGTHRGVYLLIVDRTGSIHHIHRLNGYQPRA